MRPKDYISLLKILILFHFTVNLSAQNWGWIKTLDSPDHESGSSVVVDDSGALFFSGIFDGTLSIDGTEITSTGKDDIFVGKFDSEGNLLWLNSGGGAFDEAVSKIALNAQNKLICAGAYLGQASFEDQTLNSQLNPKALFLLQYTSEGSLNWAKSIDGTGLKSLEDIATDPDGNIYLCGYFEDSIRIENTSLNGPHSNSRLFIVKLNSNGQLLWVRQEGKLGDIRAGALTVNDQQEIFITGAYNDTTYIGNDTLFANTFDWDVFVAKFDAEGQAIWAKKAGGVHEEEASGIALDSNENIYVSGSMVGVMKLSDDISIQTPTGNPECFLLKYDPEGTPLIARAFGGDEWQESTGLVIQDNKVFLCGLYQNNMKVLDISLEESEAYAGFLMEFDTLLVPQWAKSINSTSGVFPETIAANASGSIFITGAFQENISFGSSEFLSSGGNDGFIARLDTGPNAVQNASASPRIFLFPNPASEWLHIEVPFKKYSIKLFNDSGKLLFSKENLKKINTFDLPPGVYNLLFESEGERWLRRFVKH